MDGVLRIVRSGTLRHLADAAWVGAGLIALVAIVVPPARTGAWFGLRQFQTGELTTEEPLGQQFRMNAADLSAVEFRPVAVGPVSGQFRLLLRDVSAGDVQRIRDVPAADLVSAGSFVFDFPPIPDSARHLFHFEVIPAPEHPGRGVALRAIRGRHLDDGSLVVNERSRDADLLFRTRTRTPAASLLDRLTRGADPERPPRWPALVALLGSWVALRFVLQALAAPPAAPVPARAPSTAAPAVPAEPPVAAR